MTLREKAIEAAARAIVYVYVEHEVGGKHPEVCPTDIKAATAALDAILSVIIVPDLEMMEEGYDATRIDDGTPQFGKAGFCLGHAADIYCVMIRKLQEV